MGEPLVNSERESNIKNGHRVDPSWNGVYKAGGISMMAVGILYLCGSTCGVMLGTPPGNTEAYLQTLAAHPLLAQATYWIFTIADLFFIPAILGLYLALIGINKSAMLIATGIIGCFVILDLGITESNTLALITLTQNYAAATNDAMRAVYLAAERWGLATLPIATFFSWIGPTIGFLITSIVMLRSSFGKPTAILGVITYGLAIIASFYFLYQLPVLSLLLTPILILYGIWLIAAGRRLFRLGFQDV